MPTKNDSTVITKTSIPLVKGTKSDDIWTKVKSTAAGSAAIAASSIGSASSSGKPAAAQDSHDARAPDESAGTGKTSRRSDYPLKEFGDGGEVIVAHEHVAEIWDWSPSAEKAAAVKPDGDSLYLQACTQPIEGSIGLVKLLRSTKKGVKYTLLVGYESEEYDQLFKIVEIGTSAQETVHKIVLPPSMDGSAPYHCADFDKYFMLSTSEGSIAVFHKKNYAPLSRDELSCKIVNGSPCCAVQGDWLIYYPSPQDPLYHKILEDKYALTPLNLPKAGPLLNRVLKNLSHTAIDSVFKIAEISHSRLKKLMTQNGANVEGQEDVAMTKTLRDTITKILNALNETSSKQILVAVSLSSGEPVFAFSPPGGCSHVSVSPYDFLLTTVTLRGDDIFVWDFTNFDRQISLIEKFKRGKTPGVVQQVLWYPGNRFVGVLSRNSGSLHWFQNNFMNEYVESDNWTMSSFGLTKLQLADNGKIMAFDSKNSLKIVDPKGFCNTAYPLPTKEIPQALLPTYLSKNNGSASSSTAATAKPSLQDSLQQIEAPVKPQNAIGEPAECSVSSLGLNYTLPYEFFYKSRKVEFYDKQSRDLTDWFSANDAKNLVKIDFGRANGVAVFHDTKESLNMLLSET